MADDTPKKGKMSIEVVGDFTKFESSLRNMEKKSILVGRNISNSFSQIFDSRGVEKYISNLKICTSELEKMASSSVTGTNATQKQFAAMSEGISKLTSKMNDLSSVQQNTFKVSPAIEFYNGLRKVQEVVGTAKFAMSGFSSTMSFVNNDLRYQAKLISASIGKFGLLQTAMVALTSPAGAAVAAVGAVAAVVYSFIGNSEKKIEEFTKKYSELSQLASNNPKARQAAENQMKQSLSFMEDYQLNLAGWRTGSERNSITGKLSLYDDSGIGNIRQYSRDSVGPHGATNLYKYTDSFAKRNKLADDLKNILAPIDGDALKNKSSEHGRSDLGQAISKLQSLMEKENLYGESSLVFLVDKLKALEASYASSLLIREELDKRKKEEVDKKTGELFSIADGVFKNVKTSTYEHVLNAINTLFPKEMLESLDASKSETVASEPHFSFGNASYKDDYSDRTKEIYEKINNETKSLLAENRELLEELNGTSLDSYLIKIDEELIEKLEEVVRLEQELLANRVAFEKTGKIDLFDKSLSNIQDQKDNLTNNANIKKDIAVGKQTEKDLGAKKELLSLKGDVKGAYKTESEILESQMKNASGSELEVLTEKKRIADARANTDVFGMVETGMNRVVGEVGQGFIDFFEVGIPDALLSATDSVAGLFTDIMSGSKSASEAFQDLGKSLQNIATQMVEDLVKVTTRMLIFGAVQSMFGLGPEKDEPKKDKSPLSFILPTFNAKGNVYSTPSLSAYSNSIVSTPTIFPFAKGGIGLMGEAGAEAIMPLTRMSSGDLGVRVDMDNESSNSSSSANVITNVFVENHGANVETQKTTNGSGGTDIRLIITNAVSEDIARGGATWSAISGRMARNNKIPYGA